MTATLSRRRPTPELNGHSPSAPARPRGVNRARAGLGVLITALSVVTVLTLYAGADDRTDVLALATRVPAGQAIVAGDLTIVEIPTDSTLSALPADQAESVVGQVALSTLEAGTLLAPPLVAAQPVIPNGSAVVGAVLKPGQYPVGLQVGDDVRIIESPVASSTLAVSPIDRGEARVVDLAEAPSGSGGLVVSMLVGNDAAVDLSSAGAAGRLSLAVVPS